MSGWLTAGVPGLVQTTGLEQASFDTENTAGNNPLTGSINLQQLALLMSYYTDGLDKTTVAGSRYFTSVSIQQPAVLNGIAVKVGGTGGTDDWLVELHGPTGLLLATSNTAGATAGTANTWQQFAFTATYSLTIPGTYWLCLQTNGTTAKFSSINVPATSAVLTGSATGTFGTGASITPPTTYTANLGPKAVVY